MRGAIIFVVAFLIFLVVTLGYSSLPPGQLIYDAVVGAETDYPVLGISISLLAVAVFNGVIYGVIIWLIYTLADKAGLIPKRQKSPTTTTST